MEITANDEPTEIEADVDKRFSSIIVNLPVRQTGTGTPSPSNPRPFTMWTDVSLYVSDTEEADDPTLSIELPTPMYGGKVDMVRGEIATTYNSKESGTGWEMTEEGQFRCQVSAYNNGDETSTDVADLYAVHYETVSNKDAYDATDDLTCGLATIAGTTYLYVNDAQYTTLESFATHIADEVFVFRAHIPMSDVTEPHIVYLPAGTSYVWADAGFVDLTVSGTPPLSLPNSLGKPLKAWSVDVLPYQEGTGDPSPDNVRAIHGTDKLTITTAGKNLFNWDRLQGTPNPTDVYASPRIMDTEHYYAGLTRNNYYKSINISSYSIDNGHISVTATSGGYGLGFPASVIGSKTYRVSYINIANAKINVGFYDADWNFISDIDNVTYFNTPSNAQYVTLIITPIELTDGAAIVENVQLEFGSTASDYVPYVAPSQTVLTLPQTVYTGTIGSDGGESNKAYALLNDPDKWIDSGTSTITFQYNQEFLDRRRYAGSFEGLMCTYYPVDSSLTNVARWRGAASYYCGIKTNSLTLDQIKADAAAGKIAICYDLATPTTFAVTAPTIPTPTGTATTWATAEDGTVDGMEVTYVGKAT